MQMLLLALAATQAAPSELRAQVLFGAELSEPVPPALMRLPGIRPVETPRFTPADYPAAAIAARRQGLSKLRVRIAADDRLLSCAPIGGSADAELSRLACQLVSARGTFRHALAVDGTPVEADRIVLLEWRLTDPAEAGISPAPAPPRIADPAEGWPIRGAAPTNIGVAKVPDWRKSAPPGRKSGDVVIGVRAAPDNSVTNCAIWRSSGDAELDAATCAGARSGKFIASPRAPNAAIPVLVRWDRGRARHQLPMRPYARSAMVEGMNLAYPFTVPTPPIPAGPYERNFAIVEVRVSGEGRPTGCTVFVTTAVDAADAALCRHATEAMRYTPGSDVFGAPEPDEVAVRFNLP